eukprot:2319574-Pyramimonas_sp.AAC.2
MEGPPAPDPKPPAPSGTLQQIAAKVLMKILHGAARTARPDLLSAVCKTAACVAKWTEQQDIYLFHILISGGYDSLPPGVLGGRST